MAVGLACFLHANQGIPLSTKFQVTGLFYENGGYKCRKHLDIKRIGSLKSEPDLMVVMMNPGSSYPLDGIDNNSVPTETKPDNTQQQIIKIMDSGKIEFARILNLSDLRTSDSKCLYQFIKSKEAQSINHSIFNPARKSELDYLFVKTVPVIFGWGIDSALEPLAKQAIEALSIEAPLGRHKADSKYSYYHPLPRIYKQQIEWVDYVKNQLTSRLSGPVA